jgi:hypothetical protein
MGGTYPVHHKLLRRNAIVVAFNAMQCESDMPLSERFAFGEAASELSYTVCLICFSL